MEPAQIVLIIVALTLTTVLSLIGIQLFLILKEVRLSVKKANQIIDESHAMVKAVAEPVTLLGEGLGRLAGGLQLISRFLPKHDSGKEKEK
jgi:hypothetical protein